MSDLPITHITCSPAQRNKAKKYIAALAKEMQTQGKEETAQGLRAMRLKSRPGHPRGLLVMHSAQQPLFTVVLRDGTMKQIPKAYWPDYKDTTP